MVQSNTYERQCSLESSSCIHAMIANKSRILLLIESVECDFIFPFNSSYLLPDSSVWIYSIVFSNQLQPCHVKAILLRGVYLIL